MNISPSYKRDTLARTPGYIDAYGQMLPGLKLDNMEEKNTLTGIIRCIEDGLGELVVAKKQCGGVDGAKEKAEIEKIGKIQSKVDQLKNIIFLNINQIFINMYPDALGIKHQHRTHHTEDSNTNKSNNSSAKSMTVTDFELEATHKNIDNINSIEVNPDKMTHYQRKYASNDDKSSQMRKDEDEDNSEKRIDRERDEGYITPFDLGDIEKIENKQNIRIEDEGDDFPDLICYQNQTMNDRRGVIGNTDRTNTFSPISERPLQEQCSIEKALIESQSNISFAVNQLQFQPTACFGGSIKKKLFCYNGQIKLKRMSTKKFNYLDQQ